MINIEKTINEIESWLNATDGIETEIELLQHLPPFIAIAHALELLKEQDELIRKLQKDKDKLCLEVSEWKHKYHDRPLEEEQEAVKPHYNAHTNWYECGICRYSITSGSHCRSRLLPTFRVGFCANCGQPVDWQELEQGGEQE